MKTLEQKQEIARGLKADELLELYTSYVQHFDPFDKDFFERYQVVKDEILRRLSNETSKN